jgi:hypothetical protein
MPISRVHKLEAVLAISIAFFLVEISSESVCAVHPRLAG